MVKNLSFAKNQNLNIKMIFMVVLFTLISSIGFFSVSSGQDSGYGSGTSVPTGPAPIYRSYTPMASKHFYTASLGEQTVANGYSPEGIGFQGYTSAPAGGTPVYRAFNPNNQDHLYTISFSEYVNAQNSGYRLEGVGFYEYASVSSAAGDGTTGVFTSPVYRLNAASTGDHFYTASAAEKDFAATQGYKVEGIAFFAPQ